jgi:hypothetical protein
MNVSQFDRGGFQQNGSLDLLTDGLCIQSALINLKNLTIESQR